MPEPQRFARNITEPIPHGGFDYQELARRGLAPDDVIDFSTNVNPFGPPPRVRTALQQVPLDRYPDRECIALRERLAAARRTRPERLLIGNGSSELIGLIGLAFLKPGDRVLIPQPTYGEYARVARTCGAQVMECRAIEAERFRIPVENIDRLLNDFSPSICFLCRPNNPTGELLPDPVVRQWVHRHPETLFVVDEAYLDFIPTAPSLAAMAANNLLVLGSFGKAQGLAGLRIGFAHGDDRLLRAMKVLQPPWSVSAAAQAAGLAVLEESDHLQASLMRLAQIRQEFVEALTAAGFEPLPSAAPFILVDVGDAGTIRARLLDRNILVRDCSSFGLPQFMRVSPRLPQDNAALVRELRQLRADGSFPRDRHAPADHIQQRTSPSPE